MTNKTGYIIGIVSALIYTLLHNNFNTNYLLNSLPQILGAFIGALSVPAIISGIIFIFAKKDFGKIFGITCIIVHIFSAFGNIVGN